MKEEFELSFAGGPLGITISPTDDAVSIREIKEKCPYRNRLRIGDIMTAINGRRLLDAIETERMDPQAFETLVKLLQTTARPVLIRFERKETDWQYRSLENFECVQGGDSIWELIFEAGPLGITITPHDQKFVMIRHVKPGCPHKSRLCIGDIMTAINDIPLLEIIGYEQMNARAFEYLVKLLQAAPRPIRIQFERISSTSFYDDRPSSGSAAAIAAEESWKAFVSASARREFKRLTTKRAASMRLADSDDAISEGGSLSEEDEDDKEEDDDESEDTEDFDTDPASRAEWANFFATVDKNEKSNMQQQITPDSPTETSPSKELTDQAKSQVEREWTALRQGVVASAVRAAEAREQGIDGGGGLNGNNNNNRPPPSITGAVKLPGLAGPGAFVDDERIEKAFRDWDSSRDNRLEFSYERPMPGLVAKMADAKAQSNNATKNNNDSFIEDSVKVDDVDEEEKYNAALLAPEPDEFADDESYPVFEHVLLLGVQPHGAASTARRAAEQRLAHKKGNVSTVIDSVLAASDTRKNMIKSSSSKNLANSNGKAQAEVLHEYPSRCVSAELASTVCCFCAAEGVEIAAECRSRRETESAGLRETQSENNYRTIVHVFGGAGTEPLYAVVVAGLSRRDAYLPNQQANNASSLPALVVRSELRIVVLTRRASLLGLHLQAGVLIASDVGAALSAASRAGADADACCAAAAAAVSRFACAYARVKIGPPGVRAKWTPPPPVDERAFDNGRNLMSEHQNQSRQRQDVIFVRARGDVDAGQSVWDGTGAAILEWALPTLLKRLRLGIVLKALAALLAEVTVVVECQDEAELSACVLALLTLAKPLHPAGPLIVVLPSRFDDYLDSPVPVLVGVQRAPIERLRARDKEHSCGAPALLVRCDHDTVHVFGGATAELVTLPAERRVHRALAIHATTIKAALGGSTKRASGSNNIGKNSNALIMVPAHHRGSGGIIFPSAGSWLLAASSDAFLTTHEKGNFQRAAVKMAMNGRPRRSRSVGANERYYRALAQYQSGSRRQARGGFVSSSPNDVSIDRILAESVAVRDALREVARTVARHVAVLAAAALELVDKRDNLAAEENTLNEALGLKPDLPPFTAAFLGSQLFANFRNSLDRAGAPAWKRRLAAALRPGSSDADNYYSAVSKALRHATVHRPVIRSGTRRKSTRAPRRWWRTNTPPHHTTAVTSRASSGG
uniref:PDZ domain-containing protein n=1 Tax=Aureoumbra lagunensis TaxID=44058 RepID=A0A7S3NPM9_9STRA